MEKAILRMESILEDLHLTRDPSKALPTHKGFQLNETLEEIIREKRAEYINLNIEVIYKNNAKADKICGDRSAVLRIISNLINNSVEACDAAPQVKIEVKRESSQVKLSIADNGKGINQQDLAKVTEFGFTSKSSGFGIGLAHAKETMESFGGLLSIESVVNERTIVHLNFKVSS